MTRQPAIAPSVPLRTFEARAMGSPLRLTMLDGTDTSAAWRCVLDEFEQAEEVMSRFRGTSELTRLNRLAGSGRPLIVSGRLRMALTTSERARRMTAGRFDPRVFDDLERIGYRGAPVGESPGQTGARPHGPVVRLHSRAELVLDERIDLGGIGKGLTLRWAATALRQRGVEDFLLEAGGDVVAQGHPPDADSWVVGIEDPMGGAALRAAITPGVGLAAIATSSVRVNRWRVGDREVHHLLDPATGEPGGTGLASVTVAGPDPAWAEVWSKTLFLAGAATIADEARNRGLAAWWIDEGGVLSMTPAARQLTGWVAGEA